MTSPQVEQQPITPRQREVLAFIARHYATTGYAVTNRDICRQFNFVSPNGAVSHLRPLRRHGLVTWQQGQARTIRATQAGVDLLEGTTDG
jgi:SOS-response transcriptional repressor LexA